jgi:phage FluMu protein Com
MNFSTFRTFRCPKCGHKFNPSIFAFLFQIRLIEAGRYIKQLLKCPACRRISICTTV